MLAHFIESRCNLISEYLKKKNYWTEDEPNNTQNPPESDTEAPPASNPEVPGSSENLNPQAPGTSENPNPEASESSENPNPEAQPVERPATLDLPGPIARVPESGHRDVEAERNERLRTLNLQSQALESPVRNPLPSETDVLTSFSLLSNGRYIFSFNDSRLYLTSLDGIKFISLCWVVLSHACYVTETLPAINYISIFKVSRYSVK